MSGSLNVVIRPDGEVSGDQASFWYKGLASIWIIEDDYGNYNSANYHSGRDTLATLNLSCCTAIIKATVGTAAHLASPV